METEGIAEPRFCRESNSEVKTLNITHNQAFLFFRTAFPTKAVNFTFKFVVQTLSQEARECFCEAVG